MEKYLENIIEEADKRKIPLTVLCENAGLAKNTIANWKRGSEPSVDKVIKIIKYLNISADKILELNTYVPVNNRKALEEIRYMRKVFNYILESDNIKEIHELALGGIDYANKEHKHILENE